MTKKRLIGVCAAAICVAFPAAASAQPDVRDVAQKVRSADAAFALAQQAAEQGNVQELLAALRSEQKLARAAYRKAGQVDGIANVARAERKVAVHYDGSFNTLAAIVDQVPAEVQPIVLEALGRSSAARDEVIASLTELAGRLPAQAREAVISAITRMQTDGDLESIVSAIGNARLNAATRADLSELLGTITARLDDAMVRLEGLVGQLPPAAQAPVAAAIEIVNNHLGEVAEILSGVLGSLPSGSGPTSLPVGGLPVGGLCEALGGFGIPLPICP